MDFADATLVHLADREGTSVVLTTASHPRACDAPLVVNSAVDVALPP